MIVCLSWDKQLITGDIAIFYIDFHALFLLQLALKINLDDFNNNLFLFKHTIAINNLTIVLTIRVQKRSRVKHHNTEPVMEGIDGEDKDFFLKNIDFFIPSLHTSVIILDFILY